MTLRRMQKSLSGAPMTLITILPKQRGHIMMFSPILAAIPVVCDDDITSVDKVFVSVFDDGR